jgi:hypothetical protein
MTARRVAVEAAVAMAREAGFAARRPGVAR